MQNLEKRVAALETIEPPVEELTIIRRIVCPGHLEAEIDHIRDAAGQEWTRQPGESETTFTERAASETQANKWGVKSLIGTIREIDHASH
jgi:hypothetical protein